VLETVVLKEDKKTFETEGVLGVEVEENSVGDVELVCVFIKFEVNALVVKRSAVCVKFVVEFKTELVIASSKLAVLDEILVEVNVRNELV
jgi:hypothetical protein